MSLTNCSGGKFKLKIMNLQSGASSWENSKWRLFNLGVKVSTMVGHGHNLLLEQESEFKHKLNARSIKIKPKNFPWDTVMILVISSIDCRHTLIPETDLDMFHEIDSKYHSNVCHQRL